MWPTGPWVEVGKKHIFPLHLFLFFEGASHTYWTSSVVKPNHAVTFWPAHTMAALAHVLRLETQLASSFLVDSSCVDTSGYPSDSFELSGLWGAHPRLYFSLYYFYHIKFKITFCTLPRGALPSAVGAYANAGWLEREAGEMFGLPLYPKPDARSLLLDYAAESAPMGRLYPCVGDSEILYSPLDEEVRSHPSLAAEL
jgi:NADH:ubiquinone oxidoreductase subunit C